VAPVANGPARVRVNWNATLSCQAARGVGAPDGGPRRAALDAAEMGGPSVAVLGFAGNC